MTEYKYSFENFNKESMARSCASNLSISLKKSVELANALRGKKVSSAVKYLEGVTKQKVVVPYRRYRAEMGHKRGAGIDTGGYPVKVAEEFINTIRQLMLS